MNREIFTRELSYTFSRIRNDLKSTSLKSLFALFAFFLLFAGKSLQAQIVIDGKPGDWANFRTNTLYATNAYAKDANNTNDNQFTQGSKDGDAISAWRWSNGQTNNKGDISNAAAILIGTNLYFSGDRAVNNGDAAIGFWFFKNEIAMTGTTSGGFTGEHANGDLLIVSHFTQGGGQADIYVYVWNGSGLTGPTTYSTAKVNDAAENVPAGFTYATAQYPIGDFFEGMVDLTTLKVSPCFANFLLETRNSQSITASLQDLAFGSFTQTIPPPATTGAQRCGDGEVTLQASGCTGGTLNWYTASIGGTLVNTGTSYTVNITQTTTYYVSCTSADGCISRRTAVTATKNPIPNVVAAASPAGPVSIASAPPHYNLSTTVDGVLNNSNFNYSWVQDPPEAGNTGQLSSNTVANPSFTAYIAGEFKWTVTATDKTTGCYNTSYVIRQISAAAGCPTVPRSPVCQGTTHTYTASVAPAATETWKWTVNNGATINGADNAQSVSVTAGSQSFTLTLTKTYANSNLAPTVCTYPITVNPPDPAPATTYIPPTCTESTFSVQVNNPAVVSTYTLKQLDGNTVNIGPYASGNLIFTGLHIGQGYSVMSTTSQGCISNPDECGNFAVPVTSKTSEGLSPTIASKIEPTKVAPSVKISQPETVQQNPVVLAAPNPYNSYIRFTVTSPVAGKGSLELFNFYGQKMATVYQGYFEKGRTQNFEYKVPSTQVVNMIYLLRIGDQKVTGKLLGNR
ncbi:MAG TPA: hypothetical protein VLL95_12590 [Phnomibacter sp.]|nr:hypothetical protein [Phnomibacter sp.]